MYTWDNCKAYTQVSNTNMYLREINISKEENYLDNISFHINKTIMVLAIAIIFYAIQNDLRGYQHMTPKK